MPRPRAYPYGADITSPHLSFRAGDPSLNFANTVELRKGPEPQEYLRQYGDVLVFACRIELLEAGQVGRIEKEASSHPRLAAAALTRARDLRETVHAVMQAEATGVSPARDHMTVLHSWWRRATHHAELRRSDSGAFRPSVRVAHVDAVSWAVALAAVELLCSEKVSRLKECRGSDCGWLFLDTSRNRTRSWCSMKACGNRAKAARYYARHSRR